MGHCCGFTNIAEWYVQAESLQGDGSRTRQEIPHTAGCKARACNWYFTAVVTLLLSLNLIQGITSLLLSRHALDGETQAKAKILKYFWRLSPFSDARLFCKNKLKIGNSTEKQAQHALAWKSNKTKNQQEN